MNTPTLIAFLAVATVAAISFWCLLSQSRATAAPDEERADLFEHDFLRWLRVCRDFPKLNHDWQSPQAGDYGLTEERAEAIRTRTRRDFERNL